MLFECSNDIVKTPFDVFFYCQKVFFTRFAVDLSRIDSEKKFILLRSKELFVSIAISLKNKTVDLTVFL